MTIIPSERRIDWTYAGIPGGIPSRITEHTLPNYQNYNSQQADATSVINNAWGGVPSGETLYLPDGTYLINGSIAIPSNKTLRGAGMGITTLRKGGSSDIPCVKMDNGGIYDSLEGESIDTRTITSAIKDSQTITLSSTTGISAGDYLLLTQLNSGDVTKYGWASGSQTDAGNIAGIANGTRALGQMVEISAKNGNDLTTTFPVHWTFNTDLTPWAYYIPQNYMQRYAGVENLTVTQSSKISSYLVHGYGAYRCWVKNVEVSYCDKAAIFWESTSIQCEVRGCYVHHPVVSFGNGEGYGVVTTWYGTNNLYEDNILYYLAITSVEFHGGSSGCVVGYNYFYDLHYEDETYLAGGMMGNHGAHPKMILWEGNIANRLDGDHVWGSSSHQTVFRNYLRGWQSNTQTIFNSAVQIAKQNYYWNIVGNVLGTSGKHESGVGGLYIVTPTGVNGTSTKSQWGPYTHPSIYLLGVDWQGDGANDDGVMDVTLLHGNYDYYNANTMWDESIEDHTIPNSLYLSAKPSWWDNACPWPPIGSDISPMVNYIPAQRRYLGLPLDQGGAYNVILSYKAS